MEHLVSHIAIIPARGGSKQIRRNNIVPFQNRTMISWTITGAHNCNVFDQEIVSTDDEEIATVTRAKVAEGPLLRTLHADDINNLEMAEVLEQIAANTKSSLCA